MSARMAINKKQCSFTVCEEESEYGVLFHVDKNNPLLSGATGTRHLTCERIPVFSFGGTSTIEFSDAKVGNIIGNTKYF